MLPGLEHLYADSGFHLFFLILRFFCLQVYNTWREAITALGGFRLLDSIDFATLQQPCSSQSPSSFSSFILIFTILIILIIPSILIILIILIILFVLIIAVINSFLLPSLSSSSVSFIVLVSNLINIKISALFVTCSNSKKPRETVAAFRLHLANPPLRSPAIAFVPPPWPQVQVSILWFFITQPDHFSTEPSEWHVPALWCEEKTCAHWATHRAVPHSTRRKLRWAHGGTACVEATEMDQFFFLCRTGQKTSDLLIGMWLVCDWTILDPYFPSSIHICIYIYISIVQYVLAVAVHVGQSLVGVLGDAWNNTSCSRGLLIFPPLT